MSLGANVDLERRILMALGASRPGLTVAAIGGSLKPDGGPQIDRVVLAGVIQRLEREGRIVPGTRRGRHVWRLAGQCVVLDDALADDTFIRALRGEV